MSKRSHRSGKRLRRTRRDESMDIAEWVETIAIAVFAAVFILYNLKGLGVI